MLEHRGPVWRHAPAALGTALLVVAAVVGTQVALTGAGSPRAPLSPYGEGGFTVGVAAVDKRISITSADDGSYVLGYTPAGGDVVLDLDLLSGDRAQPWWFDAATGRTLKMAALASAGVARFPVPTEGGGPAWVLVVDDVAAGYGSPDTEVVVQATGEGGAAATGASGTGSVDASPAGTSGSTGTGSSGSGSSGSDSSAGGQGSSDTEGAVQPGDDPASGSSPEEGRFGSSDGDGSGGDSGPSTGEKEPESGGSTKDAPTAEKPEAAPKPAPKAVPKAPPGPAPKASTDPSWDELAQCESTGNWAIDSGNGYYGGLQFDEGTWSDFGGTQYAPRADGATKEQQIEIATKVRDARGGYSSWPACSSKLGLPK